GRAALRRGGAAGVRRVWRPHVPRRDAGGRRRRGVPDGGRASRRSQDAPAPHGARLYGGGAHTRHDDRRRGRRRAGPRVPLLDPRPGAGRRRARLPDRPAWRAGARRGLSCRPDAHELHPPALRLEPRAPARLRQGVRRVARVSATAHAIALVLVASAPAAAFSARDMLGREEALAQLKRLGIPTYLVAAHHVRDVTDLIARLGALTGYQQAAGPLLVHLERRVAAVTAAVAPLPRPRVLYVLWPEPLIVPG